MARTKSKSKRRVQNLSKTKSKCFLTNGEKLPVKIAKRQTKPELKKGAKGVPIIDEILSSSTESILNPLVFENRLRRDFFDSPTEMLAVSLLGKVLCRKTTQGDILCGKIVETEAYLGTVDAACHSYGGKRTARNAPMYAPPGTAYVYFIYGMYYCFNISSKDEGACVLIRALEPLNGLSQMQKLRNAKRKEAKSFKEHELTNGPSKLCSALEITKDELNNIDMTIAEQFWVADLGFDEFSVVQTTRIGIDSYGKDAVQKKYRFYIMGNKNISVRDKNAEANLKL